MTGRATKLVIFDLDGTLLDTLADLAAATNVAMTAFGHPTHSLAAVRRMVGNGVAKLIERALPEGAADQQFAAVLEHFKEYYGRHKADQTAPYEGITELLATLCDRGIAVAVASNKPDEAVKALVKTYFPNIEFAYVIGQSDRHPTKPAPDMVWEVLEQLQIEREQTLYVGDSEVDMQTARAAGLTAVGCSWGFRDVEELEAEGADVIIHRPQDLLAQVKTAQKPSSIPTDSPSQLICIDVDGTLMGKDKVIPPENIQAIAEAIDKGHQVVIATGRMPSATLPLLKELGLHDRPGYCICCNGGLIVELPSGRYLYENKMDRAVVGEVAAAVKEAGLHSIAYTAEGTVSEAPSPSYDWYLERTGMTGEIISSMADCEAVIPYKTVVCHIEDQKALRTFRHTYGTFGRTDIHAIFTAKGLLEYLPLTTTKGEGLRKLCEISGHSLEHTVAIGDQENDISMLQTAAKAIAVQNATKTVKQVVQLVTEKTCEEGAVAEAIRRFVLGK